MSKQLQCVLAFYWIFSLRKYATATPLICTLDITWWYLLQKYNLLGTRFMGYQAAKSAAYPFCLVDLCQSRRYVLYTNPIYWVHRALENAEIMGYQAAKSATSVLFSSKSLCTGPSDPRGNRLSQILRDLSTLFKLSSRVVFKNRKTQTICHFINL